MVKTFNDTACVIVKHANPCGVAVGSSLFEATIALINSIQTSAFGCIIAFNRELDAETAQAIVDRQFVEVIIAPSVSKGSRSGCCQQAKRSSISMWRIGRSTGSLRLHTCHSGLLVQDRDLGSVTEADLKVVTERAPTQQEMADLLFAWKVAKYVKSQCHRLC